MRDIVASWIVFVVALPLCLGIALASGAPPGAGLITSIVGGIIVGVLSGAPLMVSGPAAGLTALVFQLIQQHGLEGLAIITVMSGLIQIALSALRAGPLFKYVPNAVLEGMLCAIGAIIALGQLHVLLGQGVPKSAWQSLTALPASLQEMAVAAAACGALGLALQAFWPRIAPKLGPLKTLPGALPAVIVVTLISQFWDMPRVELAPMLPAIQDQFGRFASLEWLGSMSTYLIPALAVAVVASAESLLTARALDVIKAKDPEHRPASLNRELFAQGAGNAISGLIGGLPMTGVIVRSAANVNAGAKTRLSTILHGVWILILAGAVPMILTRIPLAALASVLIMTGFKLLNLGHLRHVLRTAPRDGAIWIATFGAIVATDLLKGLVFGLACHGISAWFGTKKTAPAHLEAHHPGEPQKKSA